MFLASEEQCCFSLTAAPRPQHRRLPPSPARDRRAQLGAVLRQRHGPLGTRRSRRCLDFPCAVRRSRSDGVDREQLARLHFWRLCAFFLLSLLACSTCMCAGSDPPSPCVQGDAPWSADISPTGTNCAALADDPELQIDCQSGYRGTSACFLFGLGPGEPARFDPTTPTSAGYSQPVYHYQQATSSWPKWGSGGHDLSLNPHWEHGRLGAGYCGLGDVTYSAGPDQICGHGNWGETRLVVYYAI